MSISFNVNFFHVPFYPPVMFPTLLASLNIDIGIAPLQDNEFNHSKSCVKFYEYAATGAATLTSKVLPYTKEVGYCAKNNVKDWVAKLKTGIYIRSLKNGKKHLTLKKYD